jgi:hypothetical protein
MVFHVPLLAQDCEPKHASIPGSLMAGELESSKETSALTEEISVGGTRLAHEDICQSCREERLEDGQ